VPIPVSAPKKHNLPTRDSPDHVHNSFGHSEVRMFQASNAFVNACHEATVAMHALTAKIRELEKQVSATQKVKKPLTR
jgi:hypothetical protein